ncbi:unnamed protein product [Hermetia illucens]|uniref:Uncharacterized protein n=1 Tax=Hermetia illucens TaxID=343691 RepID=A0A7R8V526_HERIL|nr:unnamed protein product [Hermetia illucens]
MKSLVGLGIPCRMTVLRYEAKKSRRYNGNGREGGFQNAAIFIGEESLWGESSGAGAAARHIFCRRRWSIVLCCTGQEYSRGDGSTVQIIDKEEDIL